LDKSMLSLHNRIIEEVYERYMKYEIHNAATLLRDYLWDIFASHYVELVKARAYNSEGAYTKEEQKSALYTLHKILKDILIMLHPVVPFITYKIMKDVYGKNITEMKFPEKIDVYSSVDFDDLMEINKAVWKYKKDKNMSLRDEIKILKVNEKFMPFEKDLIMMHHVKKIKYHKENSIEIEG